MISYVGLIKVECLKGSIFAYAIVTLALVIATLSASNLAPREENVFSSNH
jgi:hypothetical protein